MQPSIESEAQGQDGHGERETSSARELINRHIVALCGFVIAKHVGKEFQRSVVCGVIAILGTGDIELDNAFCVQPTGFVELEGQVHGHFFELLAYHIVFVLVAIASHHLLDED